MRREITIAVEGCCHGMLDAIYEQLRVRERQLGKRIDLLIICGDFQAVRNPSDLAAMSCPDKYKRLGGFFRYYNRARTAPIPTVFVGGNHEAGNHLRELYFGGWVAPNIFYMGHSGVVRFGSLRIAGISGIYKDFDYAKGYYERPPFRGHARASMHHVRAYEAFKMLQVRRPLDIVVSHDWPVGIERFGDTEGLLRRKPFFRAEVERGELGSPVNAMLLERLRPAWWFSAHMHTRFEAEVASGDTFFAGGWAGVAPYGGTAAVGQQQSTGAPRNEDEIRIGDSDSEDGGPAPAQRPRMALNLPPPKHTAATADPEDAPSPVKEPQPSSADQPQPPSPEPATLSDPRVPGRATRFLALDKCLPRREFLETITMTVDAPDDLPLQLEYDAEWLAILRLCTPHMPLDQASFVPPRHLLLPAEISPHLPLFSDQVVDRETRWVGRNVMPHGPVYVPPNFVPVAPTPDPRTHDSVSFGMAAGGAHGGGGGRGGGGRGRGRGRGGHRGAGRPPYAQPGGHRQPQDAEWVGPPPHVVYPNPQTDEFCQMVGINDPLTQRR
ncbi:lariat debranching enzyme [Coemansia interrupta]|uniref:Lariat debranching enzyme n=1 Tax=Coemansia interrupta TaxID=1126814 RepID=A0A9W8LGN4_9FUNG|nr:lariat debranching enzyme [Coemansia interrupta]